MNHDMNEETMLPIPDACARALAALEADAFTPGSEAEAHLRACAACAEARVMLLAQDEAPLPLAPAGYFEALPARIVRKLPSAKRVRKPLPSWFWATAAAVLMAVGVGGYLAGRATPAPPVLQPMAQQQPAPEESPADRALPFQDRDDDLAEVGGLSPADMQALVNKLQPASTKPQGTPK